MSNFSLEVQSLTKSVLEYIRNRIITGDLVPGQRLNENELASRLKVSRPPIREAFRVLESEHLVVSVLRKLDNKFCAVVEYLNALRQTL